MERVVKNTSKEKNNRRDRASKSPNLASLMMQAQLAMRTSRFHDAIRLTTAVLDLDSAHIGALEVLAKAQWQAGQHQELLTTIEKLVRVNPYEPGYHALRGAALQCLGRYGESMSSYMRGTAAPGAAAAVSELRSWQVDLLKNLLRDDPVFRAHYARNPEEACAARGFELGCEHSVDSRWLSRENSRVAHFVRPS